MASKRHSERLNLPSLLAVLWMFRRVGRGDDRDRPQIVGTNAVSGAVVDRAKQLAADGREDEQAVNELRGLAGGRRKTLRQAERASRFLGYHHELLEASLVNRLLKAAVTQEPISVVTSLDEERIKIVEAFDALTQSEQWTRLTQLQPALLDLEDEIEAGRFGQILARQRDSRGGRARPSSASYTQNKSSRNLSNEDEMRRRFEFAQAQTQLMRSLKRLVGPKCGHADLLLSSQRALDAAHLHLLHPPVRSRSTSLDPSL